MTFSRPFPASRHPWVSDADGANSSTAVIVGYTVAFGGTSKDFR